jgi:hypothetical protein
MAKRITRIGEITESDPDEFNAEELKASVSDMVFLMEGSERKLFIKMLQYEMFRSGLDIKDYLISLGTTVEHAEDLTPTDVGHLIRFFKISVPEAMPAVMRVLPGCPVRAEGDVLMSQWLLKALRQGAFD